MSFWRTDQYRFTRPVISASMPAACVLAMSSWRNFSTFAAEAFIRSSTAVCSAANSSG